MSKQEPAVDFDKLPEKERRELGRRYEQSCAITWDQPAPKIAKRQSDPSTPEEVHLWQEAFTASMLMYHNSTDAWRDAEWALQEYRKNHPPCPPVSDVVPRSTDGSDSSATSRVAERSRTGPSGKRRLG